MKYEKIEVGKEYDVYGTRMKCTKKIEDELGRVVHFENDKVKQMVMRGNFGYIKPLNELPETGLVVHKRGAVVMRTGFESGYGFGSRGEYQTEKDNSGWTFGIGHEGWRPATEEDEKRFKKLLEKELIRKYGEDWGNVKLKRHADKDPDGYINDRGYRVSLRNTEIWNKNGMLFHKGKWADKLEQPKSARKEFEDKLCEVYENIKQQETFEFKRFPRVPMTSECPKVILNGIPLDTRSKNININITIKNK